MKYQKCLMGTIKQQLVVTHKYRRTLPLPFVREAQACAHTCKQSWECFNPILLLHIHTWAASTPSSRGSFYFTIARAGLEMEDGTFSFMGLPRDVIVLSVTIGPLILSRIMFYCSTTANVWVHYLHPLLLKTSRAERYIKEHLICQGEACRRWLMLHTHNLHVYQVKGE